MKVVGFRRLAKCSVVVLLLAGLSGCGGSDDGVNGGGSGDSALHCIQQTATSRGVDVTNTCGATVVIATTSGTRVTIPPGQTRTITQSYSGIAACFSPYTPQINHVDNTFRCQ